MAFFGLFGAIRVDHEGYAVGGKRKLRLFTAQLITIRAEYSIHRDRGHLRS